MKISIHHFKSIEILNDFELKPLTILSGVNSSGKSSFIQLLLLLKQTLELKSFTNQLATEGTYIRLSSFLDIIYGKDRDNKLEIMLEFNKQELQVSSENYLNIFDHFDDYQCHVLIGFCCKDCVPFVCEFTVEYILPAGIKNRQKISFQYDTEIGKYSINSNTGIFGKEFNQLEAILTDKIVFNSFIPYLVEVPQYDDGMEKNVPVRITPRLEGITDAIDYFFSGISYIGPLRKEPEDFYVIRPFNMKMGSKGENVAQILEEEAERAIVNYRLKNKDGQDFYEREETSLIEAVRYWLCEEFKVSKDIVTEKKDDRYAIYLLKDERLKTSIKHVGFGISQVLPILVEGLRMGKGSTLILEQPEIHLHPRLQSQLFDFVYSLVLEGKKVIVETHSDHFINRMRRRIAEDCSNSMPKQVSITFIQEKHGKNYFDTLNLNEMGTFDFYPLDFLEQYGKETKAIVYAQSQKRKKK